MSYAQFQFSFWHPFGKHVGESTDRILKRKKREIKKNGWTLWSFQIRKEDYLKAWLKKLAKAKAVYVFCSTGEAARDPHGKGRNCKSYRYVGEKRWKRLPRRIKVPHRFRKEQKRATAFKVKKVIFPVDPCVRKTAKWFSLKASEKEGWRSDRVPTRGEYLIKPGGAAKMRSYCAVLVLKKPYLAFVSTETYKTANRKDQT